MVRMQPAPSLRRGGMSISLRAGIYIAIAFGIFFLEYMALPPLPDYSVPPAPVVPVVPYSPAPLAFSGSSDQLKRSLVVPSLATPSPGDKNVIWCCTSSMVWRQMLEGSADRRLIVNMSAGPQTLFDLDKDVESYDGASALDAPGFAASAIVAMNTPDGVARINAESQRVLGDSSANLPPPAVGEGITISAAAKFRVPFTVPFFENERALAFLGESVKSFGLIETKPSDIDGPTREQVRILYAIAPEIEAGQPEYALDLCRTSSPLQVIVARLPWRGSLQDSIRFCQGQIAVGKGAGDLDYVPLVIVPVVNFRLVHDFANLGGTRVSTGPFKGNPVVVARQSIMFCLDRNGAVVDSGAQCLIGGGISEYRFDQPSLVFLRVRATGKVVFALWVANAELLCKWEGDTPPIQTTRAGP